MRKHRTLLAAAILVASGSIALAQNQPPTGQQPAGQQKPPATSGQGQMDPARGTGMTGAPSSTNPQAGGGAAGNQAPREVPEQGGAPNTQLPNPKR